MAQRCLTCAHPNVADIDSALVEGKRSIRSVADQYGLSKGSVTRHRDNAHMAAQVVQVVEARKLSTADDLLDQLRDLKTEGQAILAEAREGYSKILKVEQGQIIRATVQDHELALRAMARLESLLELEARLLGELKDRQVVNVLVSPDWLRVKTVLTEALAQFPEARVAVASRLAALESGGDDANAG